MRSRLIFVLILMCVCGMVTGALAQNKPAQKAAPVATAPAKAEPTTPVLSELDGLKIENALLKINKAQADLEAMKASFQSLLAALQKPDYVIAQGADGKLAYQPEPKKEPEAKK